MFTTVINITFPIRAENVDVTIYICGSTQTPPHQSILAGCLSGQCCMLRRVYTDTDVMTMADITIKL